MKHKVETHSLVARQPLPVNSIDVVSAAVVCVLVLAGHVGSSLSIDYRLSIYSSSPSEAPMRAEFLQKRLISALFGFQWQNLAEILHLFKKV